VEGLELPKRVFPCASPAQVRSTLPEGKDVLAFQCRNPIHKAHYELFIRALEAANVGPEAVCLVHPTCGPTQVPACSYLLINLAPLQMGNFHMPCSCPKGKGLCNEPMNEWINECAQ